MAVWHPVDKLRYLDRSGPLVGSRLARRPFHSAVELHEPVGDCFWRILPESLVEAYNFVRRASLNCEQVDKFLHGIRRSLTWARVREGICTLGPAIWDYPAVLPATGFYPDSRKIPALRSYLRIDARLIERTDRWLQNFDPACDPGSMPIHGAYESCGSPHVLKLSEITRFAATIKQLLSEDLPPNFDAAISRYNAVVSGFFLLGPVLLGGIRNWPTEINFLEPNVGWQKGPILYEVPDLARDWSPFWVQRVLEILRIAEDAGITGCPIELRFLGPSILAVEKDRIVRQGYSQRGVTTSLLIEPQTRRWGHIFPGAMRHFSMSELYAEGYSEFEIERFHHRYSSALNPFRNHRLEPSFQGLCRREIEVFLRSRIGL